MPRFEKGRSGNPSGRKKNSPDKRSAWRRDLAEHLPDILSRVVSLAKEGDLEAIRLVLSRTCPPLRASSTTIELPALARAKSPADQARAIVAAVAKGALPPDAAADVLGALSSAARVIEVDELAARLAAIEAAMKNKARPDGDA